MFGSHLFPAPASFQEQCTKLFLDEWHRDQQSTELADAVTQTSSLGEIQKLLNKRADAFYGLAPFSDATVLALKKQPNAADLVKLCQDYLSAPFATPKLLGTPSFPTIDIEADADVIDVQLPDKISLSFYCMVIEIDNSDGGLECTLEAYSRLRKDDQIWLRAVSELCKAPEVAKQRTISFSYVGITVRHPGLRVIEHMQPDVATSRHQAMLLAAAQDLVRVHTSHILSYDIPVNPATITQDDNPVKHLFFYLRHPDHACLVDFERFLRVLLHIPALNVAPGGIDHSYRSSLETQLVLDQIAQKLADSLSEDTRTLQALASHQYAGATDLVPLGQAEHVMTMHMGKDPTREAHEWLVPFYDTSLGGLGPRTHVRSILNLVNAIQALLPPEARHHKMLPSLFLGPFRDLYEIVCKLLDPATVLAWLQTVLLEVMPWHIDCLGSDSLGAFAYGLLEVDMTTNSGQEELGESQASVGTVIEHPEISNSSKYGRSLDSSWSIRNFHTYIRRPFIGRFGPQKDNVALIVASYHPGVYAHDPHCAAIRHDINSLVIAQNAVATTITSRLVLENDSLPPSEQKSRYDLLTHHILPQVLQESVQVQERLDILKGRFQLLIGALRAMRSPAAPRNTPFVTPFTYMQCRMEGRAAVIGKRTSIRVKQVEALVRERTQLVERGMGFLLQRLLPTPPSMVDDPEAWQKFLLNLPAGTNAFYAAKSFGRVRREMGFAARSAHEKGKSVLQSRTPLQRIVDMIGDMNWPGRVTKASAFTIESCRTCHKTFVRGKDVQSPGMAEHEHAADLVASGYATFLHDFLSQENDYGDELADRVTWAGIDELLPEWMLQHMDLPTFVKNRWRMALLRSSIPVLTNVFEKLRMEVAVEKGEEGNEEEEEDEDEEWVEEGEEGKEEKEKEEDLQFRAREYAVQVALDFLFGLQESAENYSDAEFASVKGLSANQRAGIALRSENSRTRTVKFMQLADRSTPMRWAACNLCSAEAFLRRPNPKGKPGAHACPRKDGKTNQLQWVTDSPELQTFADFPGTYQKMIFRAVLYHQREVCLKLAAVGITADNIFHWQIQSLDARSNIPDSMKNAQAINIESINWVSRTVTPRKHLADIRQGVIALRRQLHGRRRTTIENASIDFLAAQGYPTSMRSTILKYIRRKEREQEASENVFPSSAIDVENPDELEQALAQEQQEFIQQEPRGVKRPWEL
ncbi:hypothetical protein DFS34DRAFT_696518 [Phlyctochytrium arcticum]|nr:hypothetical protein DFS34DRAFT_696518 [Phlyctochytrium arcticum]